MEKKFITKSGCCICGEVKFQVKLDEIPRVFNCHCVEPQICQSRESFLIYVRYVCVCYFPSRIFHWYLRFMYVTLLGFAHVFFVIFQLIFEPIFCVGREFMK